MNRSKMDLFESVDRFVMAAASDEPAAELDADFARMLQESEDACDLYIDCVQMSLLLPSLLAGEPEEQLGPDDAALLGQARGLSPYTGLAFLGNAVQGTVGYFSSGWPVAYLAATVILGMGLLIGALTPVSDLEQIARQSVLPSTFGRGAGGEGSDDLTPPRPTVGRITGMVDCRWEEDSGFRVQGSEPAVSGQWSVASGQKQSELRSSSHQPPATSHFVSVGDEFALASGLMEITYDTGAKVILQGPVTYEVESAAGGYLSVGKLTARLEKKGEKSPNLQISKSEISNPQSLIPNPSLSTNHSPLFTIKTPTATVTDLGTEFGVEVDKAGLTTSHVFRGSVKLEVATVNGGREAAARVLHENESARVERSGGKQGDNRVVVFVPASMPSNFVREIPRQTVKIFDLVDVVAGGDGFSGRRNRGIDPTTGQATNARPPSDKFHLFGNGEYHRVAKLPLVDGVFIPAGGKQPAQVDSAGHAFAEWVNTTANETYGDIWAGGRVPAQPNVTLSTKLGDIDYAAPGRGLIFLHANSGITFDLAAIRRANPGHKLVRFCAMTGNTEPNSASLGVAGADVWVLIDGQVRFRRCEINGCSGVFSVAIPIAEDDRFLTLASTDGGNGIEWDWIMFGGPRLEMEPRKPH